MDDAMADQIVNVFSDFLAQGTKFRRMKRKRLVNQIAQYCRALGLSNSKELAVFWEHADSDENLKRWLLKQGHSTRRELMQFLKVAGQLPGVLRKALTEVAKDFTPLSGGKPRALSLDQTVRARQRVEELHGRGTPRRKSWAKVAKELKVGEHTIRRACDPKEAARSGYVTASKKVGILYAPQQRKASRTEARPEADGSEK